MSAGKSFAEAAGIDNPEQFLPTAPDTKVVIGSPHDALVNILVAALRSEAGIRLRQLDGKSTGYYAGRRAGFICSAAVLVDQMYGGDYEQAKSEIGKAVHEAGEGWPTMDLLDPDTGGMLATDIAERALRAA